MDHRRASAGGALAAILLLLYYCNIILFFYYTFYLFTNPTAPWLLPIPLGDVFGEGTPTANPKLNHNHHVRVLSGVGILPELL